MPSLESAYLIAIGIALIGLEALLFSFVAFFLGLGFIAVGFINMFYPFSNLLEQIAFAFGIALILAFLLRKPLMQYLSRSQEKEKPTLKTKGIGIIEDGMIRFEGTYWNTLDDISDLPNNTKVEVIDIVDNKVKIKPLK